MESVDGAQPVEAVLQRGAVGPSRGPPVTAGSPIRRTRSWPRTVPVPPGGRPARRSPRHSAHPPSGRLPCDTGRTDGVRTSSARVTQRAREGGGPERHRGGGCPRPEVGSSGRRTAGRSAVRRGRCGPACSRTGARIRTLRLPRYHGLLPVREAMEVGDRGERWTAILTQIRAETIGLVRAGRSLESHELEFEPPAGSCTRPGTTVCTPRLGSRVVRGVDRRLAVLVHNAGIRLPGRGGEADSRRRPRGGLPLPLPPRPDPCSRPSRRLRHRGS